VDRIGKRVSGSKEKRGDCSHDSGRSGKNIALDDFRATSRRPVPAPERGVVPAGRRGSAKRRKSSSVKGQNFWWLR
jgi:hypothetical protein